jgi:glycosyltransferase involved in cell wall biosynthesis
MSRILVLCTDQGVRVPGDKGASLHLRSITRAFTELGHDVLLMGVEGHGAPDVGCPTWLLPHPGRATGVRRERNKLALTARFAAEGLAVAQDFAPDVVYERLALFGDAGLALAAATGARHVVEVNAMLSREEAQWRGLHHVAEAEELERRVLQTADHVVTVSEEWAAAVRELRPDGVTTVPNGFDEALFAAPVDRVRVRRGLGIAADVPLAVFTGTLRAWHGVEHAVAALPMLPADLRLVVVGDGPAAPELVEQAERLGVAERLVMTGRLPHAEAVAVLRSADVGLAPYPDSGDFAFSPLKVFEYLAAGLPVVASDLGQLRDILGRHASGRLATPGDPVALAAAVRAVLTDPEAPAAAEAARDRAWDECGWRARARQILSAIDTEERVA